MTTKNIKDLEKGLEQRLEEAKDQPEADGIANLILLSEINKSLKGH